MEVADVSGVTIAGIIFDTQYNSENMLVFWEKGCNLILIIKLFYKIYLLVLVGSTQV